MKKNKTLIAYLIVCTIIFIKLFIPINSSLDEEYEKILNRDTLRNEIIEELRDNPEKSELFEKEFGIKSVEDITDEKLDIVIHKSEIARYIFIGALSLGIALIITTFLFIPIFIFLSVRKKYYKYRLNADQFKGNKEYYRDLLKGYTPMELSYNNNYKIDEYALIATVLNLENKNVIEYKDKKFYVKKKVSDLSDIEKCIIKCIPDDGTEKIEVSRFALYDNTLDACIDKKLIELGYITKKKFIKDIIISAIVYGIVYYLWLKSDLFFNDTYFQSNYIFATLNSALTPVILFALFAFVHFYPGYFIIKYLILSALTRTKNFKKTELGNEINDKLGGLKNYIEDFSILDKREKDEVVLWDEYLVYSVMFNDNKKIINKYKNKVKLML